MPGDGGNELLCSGTGKVLLVFAVGYFGVYATWSDRSESGVVGTAVNQSVGVDDKEKKTANT